LRSSLLWRAEAAEDGSDLGVEGVDVVDVELVGDVGVALGCCGGTLLDFGSAVERVWVRSSASRSRAWRWSKTERHSAKTVFAAESEAVLREVAEGHAFDAGELAVVEGFDAAEDLRRVDLPVPLPPTRPVRSSGVMSQLASSKRSFWPSVCRLRRVGAFLFYFLIDGDADFLDDADSKHRRKWRLDLAGFAMAHCRWGIIDCSGIHCSRRDYGEFGGCSFSG